MRRIQVLVMFQAPPATKMASKSWPKDVMLTFFTNGATGFGPHTAAGTDLASTTPVPSRYRAWRNGKVTVGVPGGPAGAYRNRFWSVMVKNAGA